MPMYDYKCKDCDHEFEIHQSFADDALTICPSCGGDLRKVFSAVGISFKGSGFYKTDSRGSKSATSPSSTSTSSSDSASSSNAATPSTPSSDSSSSSTSSNTPSTPSSSASKTDT